jgi:parvulin-like peptidyl-prolyl isomerase
MLLLLAAAALSRAQGLPTDAIVARVNGEAILLSQLREAAIDQQMPLDADFGADPWSEAYRRALTQYVDETLLVQKASREEIKVGGDELAGEVDQLLQALRQQLGGRDRLEEWLERHHLTLESLRGVLTERERRRSLAVKIVARGVNVDAASLEAFKERRRRSGEPLEQVNLAQILVRCPPDRQKTEEGQQFYMQALIAAREAGKDPARFQELVAGYSDDPVGRLRGGSLGWLDPQTLLPALRQTVEPMKPGDVSTPIASGEGFHVLMLQGRRTTRDLAFADQFQQRREQLLKDLRAQARIQLYDLRGRPMSPPVESAATTAPKAPASPPPLHPVLPDRLSPP